MALRGTQPRGARVRACAKLRPSVIHAHDWQTGLVPVYQKMVLSSDPVVGGVPVVFTIHNLAFQGLFPASTVESIGLGWNVLDVQALEFWGQISYLKGGIIFSETITTVSPTYAREIMTPEFGFGFDGILRRRAGDLVGILNGIDIDALEPGERRVPPRVFLRGGPRRKGGREARRCSRRAGCRIGSARYGQAADRAGVPADRSEGLRPHRRGVDELMALDASWVMLGSGERRYEDLWQELAARHPGPRRR